MNPDDGGQVEDGHHAGCHCVIPPVIMWPDLLGVLCHELVMRQSSTAFLRCTEGAEKASGLTEAIRSIISTTVEGLMRTIVSV